MKKLDSSHDKETPQEELKRLRKECKKLASQKDKFMAKYDKAQKELKKKGSSAFPVGRYACLFSFDGLVFHAK